MESSECSGRFKLRSLCSGARRMRAGVVFRADLGELAWCGVVCLGKSWESWCEVLLRESAPG